MDSHKITHNAAIVVSYLRQQQTGQAAAYSVCKVDSITVKLPHSRFDTAHMPAGNLASAEPSPYPTRNDCKLKFALKHRVDLVSHTSLGNVTLTG